MALSLAPRLQPGNLLAAADSALDHNARIASISVTSVAFRSCKHISGIQLISKAAGRRSFQRKIGHSPPICQGKHLVLDVTSTWRGRLEQRQSDI